MTETRIHFQDELAQLERHALGGLELVEVADTQKIFTNPDDSRTEDYVTGKFG